MYAHVVSLGVTGLDGYPVTVETHISGGLPKFAMVGLPDSAVKESSERVRSAIKNLNCPWPASHVTVNLAPADVRKTGSLYDLPVFIGILAAQQYIPQPEPHQAFLGELGLDGALRPIAGALPMALAAQKATSSRRVTNTTVYRRFTKKHWTETPWWRKSWCWITTRKSCMITG